MIRRKKLCLLIPTIQSGGMDRVMSELAHFFCKRDELEVHLILYGRRVQTFYELPDSLIIHKPGFHFNNRFRFIYMLRRLIFLRQSVKRVNPDQILSFGEYWNSFVLLALLRLKYPIFVSDRCQPGKIMSSLQSWLRQILYPRAAGIIAQTSIAKGIYFNQLKHENIRVIGNPINISEQIKGDTKKENIVLAVGRLIQTKNHDHLIELFVRLNKPGWKLVIVGDNALNQDVRRTLVALIDRLEAGDKVLLAGRQMDVESYYRKSKIFAFASESEGFPNVIGEAQAYGLPVVAFDCVAGPSEMITNDENGFLIPLHDYELFSKKLSLLMDNSELRERMGKNGRESIKKFSTEIIGNEFYDFVMRDE